MVRIVRRCHARPQTLIPSKIKTTEMNMNTDMIVSSSSLNEQKTLHFIQQSCPHICMKCSVCVPFYQKDQVSVQTMLLRVLIPTKSSSESLAWITHATVFHSATGTSCNDK
jgi:hypothetical protein